MKSKHNIGRYMLSIFMLLLTISVNAQDTGEGHKIVFQLTNSNSSDQKALVNQLRNLTSGWPDAEIEVVVHSAGIGFLQKNVTAFENEINALSKKGVAFVACENTLKTKNIAKEAILDLADFVPMGIAEIVIKQEQGWSYIKAGL